MPTATGYTLTGTTNIRFAGDALDRRERRPRPDRGGGQGEARRRDRSGGTCGLSKRLLSGRVNTRREITLAQLTGWMLALAGSAGALSWAFLLFCADRERRAAAFAAGGLMLAIWAAAHLTDRRT